MKHSGSRGKTLSHINIRKLRMIYTYIKDMFDIEDVRELMKKHYYGDRDCPKGTAKRYIKAMLKLNRIENTSSKGVSIKGIYKKLY